MNDELPQVSVSPTRKVFFSGASFIWILPILALVVALFVAWQSYNDRGPLITVEFESGAGIKAGETELRYRDITVGQVETVGFSQGLGRVVASIRVDKSVAPYIDSSAVFWIVQPEVSAQGITGLSTVLSGVHIEGSWDDQIGSSQDSFTGASEPPLIRAGRGGLEIAFRTVGNGQLTDNAPILYKGIEVGRVGRAKIAPGGTFAVVEALIYEDHRTLINETTRFWDASGFSVNIGPSGAEIDFSSLATLVGGGVTFDTFVSGGAAVQDGSVFEIFPDKESARNSLFNASEVDPLKLSVIFDDNLSGLAVGAPVELSGLKIGEVEALSGVVDVDEFGDSRVRLNVNLSVQPARLGLPGDVTAANALAFLERRVENGLRARLASASLLTGGLKIELVEVADASPAELVSIAEDFAPKLPTTQSEVSDAAATVEGVFNRINSLPIEELLNSAITFLDSAESLVSDEALRETPQDVRDLLAEVQGLIASDDVRNIPVALNATLTRIEGLVADLEQQQLAQKLVAAIDTVAETADTVSASVVGVPGLITDIRSVAQKAEALQVEELVAEVTSLLASAEAIIASPAATALPVALKDAVDQVNATLKELREGGAVEDINQTLASARVASANVAAATTELADRLVAAIDTVADTASSVSTSIAGVPDLVTDIRAVVQKAEALRVEDLVAEVTGLVDTAEAIIASPETAALPGALKTAVDQVNATLQELRDGGAVRDINQTLASARTASTNVANATEDLPELSARISQILDDAANATDAVNSAVAGVPQLIARFEAVASKAESLQVEELLTELTNLTNTADELIGTEDAKALPGSLKRALEEVNYTLQELREGGAINNVNETLASARNAADSIAASATSLPQIIERLNGLFSQAGRTIEGYNQGDQLSRNVQETLRDIQKAADALASLARTIERNPNSLLLGR